MSRRFETLNDGRLRLTIDPEDGTHPQYVYGKDKDEILEKVATTVEHGSRHIAALKAQSARSADPPSKPAPPAPRKPMTADEQMQRTADLQNPGKAPQAVRALLDEATNGGMSEFEEWRRKNQAKTSLEQFAQTAMAWRLKHPEFPYHPANMKMLTDSATIRAGGLQNVTEEILQTSFLALLEGNYLVDVSEESPAGPPDEIPVARPARAATSYRRTNLRAGTPAATAPQPKYTREQINKMSGDELARKMTSEPGFAQLVESYAKPRTA
jgi:hypothetical protein